MRPAYVSSCLSFLVPVSRAAVLTAALFVGLAPASAQFNGGGANGGGGAIGGNGGTGGVVITVPGGGSVTIPGNVTLPGNIGNIIGNLGGNVVIPTGRIVADTGLLVGQTAQASAVTPSQSVTALTDPNTPASNTTYLWSISGGRIIGSTTTPAITYVADAAGTVTLTVSMNTGGVISNATSTITVVAATAAGAITAALNTTPSTGPQGPTLTASVPAAQNGDRTFRWSVSGDGVIVSGQNTASVTYRAGSPGLKEISCEVTLQRAITLTLRSFLVVNGDGAPSTVTINNGSGSGTYNANSRVDIFANPPAPGQVFDRWTGDVAALGANAPLAPFVPHNVITVTTAPITLTATYKSAPSWALTTVQNFNPQTQTTTGTGTTPSSTTVSTTLQYYVPAEAIGLVFLLHDAGGSTASWFATPEGMTLARDLVAAGYGVLALNSINRTTGAWATQTTLGANLDAINHRAALNKLITDGHPAATKPIFFLGNGDGATAAARYAEFLATATPARNVKGAVLYNSSGNETLAATSKVPQFFALSANDDLLGTAGLATARSNSQFLAGRGIATATSTNTVSPVHPNRFGVLGVTSTAFAATDATAVWTAVKTAGLIDANNYVKALTAPATVTAALPDAYKARAEDVAAEMNVAFAAPAFYSDADARVIAFLNARVAGTAAPAPGRLVNLSTRSKIAYVGDSFTLGFTISGPDRATLLVRGVGPALARFGVVGALSAPRLEINDNTGRVIASNERWDAAGGTATAAQITTASTSVGAFALTPGSLDAAVLLTNLAAGSYTATIKGVNGSIGDVLAEIYDVTKNNTRLTNLSTLAKIAEDGDLLIPGIVVQGANPRSLLVRAIGPGLSDFGLAASSILTDPRISVLNSAGVTLDTNNNWVQGSAATLNAVFPAVGAFPLKVTNAADAALVTSLSSGNYTLQAGAAPSALAVNGVNSTGSVLVEVYEVP